jgi:phosphate transport system substrate-binding protein
MSKIALFMRRISDVFFIMFISVFITSCDDRPMPTDTLSKGVIDISADETYQPIIEEQKKVFDSSYPEAKITIHYKSEEECFKDYFNQKARIILVTRDLSKAEHAVCEQKKIWPTSLSLARDAVAVIVNKECPDSFLDHDALKGILSGTYKTKYTVVFDNSGSSTVRFITDSILRGDTLGKNVFAAKGNKEVVDYVAKNPNAIGFVGLSYVSDENDPANTGAFIKNVKVVAVKNDSTREFLQPYQAYIALRSYPLTRTLYYINSESYPGLGTGFANFLAGQRGQLIFFHYHLFPTRSEMVIRQAEIKTGR